MLVFVALLLVGIYAAGYFAVEWVESELSDDDGWKYCNGTKVRRPIFVFYIHS